MWIASVCVILSSFDAHCTLESIFSLCAERHAHTYIWTRTRAGISDGFYSFVVGRISFFSPFTSLLIDLWKHTFIYMFIYILPVDLETKLGNLCSLYVCVCMCIRQKALNIDFWTNITIYTCSGPTDWSSFIALYSRG